MELDLKNILNLIVVFAILAALTAGIDIKQFKNRIKKPKGVVIGLLCQFGILPISSFLIAYSFNLSNPQGVALIILGSCPGGNISNIFCFLWNADLSLSIAMTTASSVLSFAFLTINCAIYIPIFTGDDDEATIDYSTLAFSVAMVICGICVGFIAAYYNLSIMKKALGVFGLIATCYMCYTALYGNTTGTAPIYTLPFNIWLAPFALCSIAWILSLIISLLFKLPKRAVLSICLESANQNSVLSAAIIYLSLDEYSDDQIDLAIGIPIMYVIVCVLFDFFFGFVACQFSWVNCKTPDDQGYTRNQDNDNDDEYDDTVTFSTVMYKLKQWKQSKKSHRLLTSDQEIEYGGIKKADNSNSHIVMTTNSSTNTLEQANFGISDNEVEKSSDDKYRADILS